MFETWITSNWQKRGLLAWSLLPLSVLYALISSIKRWCYQIGLRKTYHAPVPVVVVGNIYVGGTGKTPIILSLIQALRERGWHPGLVSRGYGSETKSEPACGTGVLNAKVFGDEPSMISRKTGIPISVFHNRAAACQALLHYDPAINVILSDDGLQHWQLGRDIELLVQDERGCGNGFVLPAGPLRESAARLRHVDAVLTRSLAAQLNEKPHEPRTHAQQGTPVLHYRFAVQVQTFVHLQSGATYSATDFASHLVSQNSVRDTDSPLANPSEALHHATILAMAGIGVPARFFQDLRTLGIHPTRCIPLPDHGAIEPEWIASMSEHTILMTEKDAARLMHAYLQPTDQTSNVSQLTASPQASDGKLCCPYADTRIWVGIAATTWQNDSLFDWVDQRLRCV